MTLNVGGPLSTETGRSRAARRRKIAQAVVAELTSWNPREFLGMFKRMHKGALSLIHLNVLIELEANGPMSMGRLADVLEVSVASATGIVDRMEKRGFVERRHDEEDRRVVVVHPTAEAEQVFRNIDEHRRDGLTNLLRDLSIDELTGLLEGHRALRAARAKHLAKKAAQAASAEAATTETAAANPTNAEATPR